MISGMPVEPAAREERCTAERKTLQSFRVDAGRRTYYFDVKVAESGNRYLLISEMRPFTVLVFEDAAAEFQDRMNEALEALKDGKRDA